MTPLLGQNIVVLDCETLRAADDCRWCALAQDAHDNANCPTRDPRLPATQYSPIGWGALYVLGLSVGCLYRFSTDQYLVFDDVMIADTMQALVTDAPLLVSMNGKQFDGPLLAHNLPMAPGPEPLEQQRCLLVQWQALWDRSYDILAEIWAADPASKFVKGLNSLEALSIANGYGMKAMSGAMAPRLWRAGQHAPVINYVLSDVWKTRKLFEQIVAGTPLRRHNGSELLLPSPTIIEGPHVS